jgi:DNA-binding NtrC family response regulator
VVEQADSGEEALSAHRGIRLRHPHYRSETSRHRRAPGARSRLERSPDIVAIVITGAWNGQDAVDAIKQGAADFITKPFLRRAAPRVELRRWNSGA